MHCYYSTRSLYCGILFQHVLIRIGVILRDRLKAKIYTIRMKIFCYKMCINMYLIRTSLVDFCFYCALGVGCFCVDVRHCVILAFKLIPEDDPNRDRNMLEQSIVT
jgi:hypothetical protein